MSEDKCGCAICCNGDIEHILIGSEEQAEDQRKELKARDEELLRKRGYDFPAGYDSEFHWTIAYADWTYHDPNWGEIGIQD